MNNRCARCPRCIALCGLRLYCSLSASHKGTDHMGELFFNHRRIELMQSWAFIDAIIFVVIFVVIHI